MIFYSVLLHEVLRLEVGAFRLQDAGLDLMSQGQRQFDRVLYSSSRSGQRFDIVVDGMKSPPVINLQQSKLTQKNTPGKLSAVLQLHRQNGDADPAETMQEHIPRNTQSEKFHSTRSLQFVTRHNSPRWPLVASWRICRKLGPRPHGERCSRGGC